MLIPYSTNTRNSRFIRHLIRLRAVYTMEAPKSPRKTNSRPRSRMSIAHTPAADTVGDKENLTVNAAGLIALTANSTFVIKKSRSKSIGPGGLDALHSDAGNRQKVGSNKEI